MRCAAKRISRVFGSEKAEVSPLSHYANYNAMSAHLTELKRTTHRHWNAWFPSQAIQQELRRIDKAHERFFKKLGEGFCQFQ